MYGSSSVASSPVGSLSRTLKVALLTIAETESVGVDAGIDAKGTVTRLLGFAELEVTGNDGDVTFLVEDVPVLLVERISGTEVSVDVENQENRKIRIYRASDEQALFSPVIITSALPYSDTGLLADNNYKYKASFAVEGTKGGSAFTVEGQRSDRRYTR